MRRVPCTRGQPGAGRGFCAREQEVCALHNGLVFRHEAQHYSIMVRFNMAFPAVHLLLVLSLYLATSGELIRVRLTYKHLAIVCLDANSIVFVAITLCVCFS